MRWTRGSATLGRSGLGILFLAGASFAGAASPPTIEQRLQRLEDRGAIENLLVGDYSKAIDTSDVAALSTLFTEDGEYSSEWTDIAAMPRPLSALFTRDDAGPAKDADRYRVTFRGRSTIANFMALVATVRPTITVEDRTAIATFDPVRTGPAAPAGGMPPMMPPKPGGSGAPPALPGPGGSSMRHLITNLTVEVDGDQATATSYWTEVGTGQDRKPTVAGGGYYSDVLQRVAGAWRIRRRVIHNYDPSAPAPSPAARGREPAPPAN